ncbi:MAG: polyphosphate kinase 1 [Victivallales bacterium]|nr:polyphosphate kinase 1 [Victivallales bacterium]
MENNITTDHFINRELSWLDFNSRVLDQAFDNDNPVLERLKFIAIFSNNLDEFFMVRVAGVRQEYEAGIKKKDPAGLTPQEQLEKINAKTKMLVRRQYNFLKDKLLPELSKNNIQLLSLNDIPQSEKMRLKRVFSKDILPTLTPVAVDPTHPFPVINNKVVEIIVELKEAKSGQTVYGFVEVPPVLPRFIDVIQQEEGKGYILIEELITEHISMLFDGCEIIHAYPFRITKDMDIIIEETEAKDFMSYMERKLKTANKRDIIRLEVPSETPHHIIEWLKTKFNISEDFVFNINGPLDLSRFFEFISINKTPELTDEKIKPLEISILDENESIFDSIKQYKAIPLFHPFESFDYVVRFLEEAAEDPNVMAIKQTLYRVSGDSPIVQSLQKAAENGKQVTVIVELKARFDESRNIIWAKRLEDSGAHVIYGMAGLKIHCKSLLIIRKEHGIIRRYIHLGTGNYNDSTAKLYTDIGIFLNDHEICSEVASLFNVMTGYSQPPAWNKISASPFNNREAFIKLIEREIRNTAPHNPGRIIAKMNSLVDKEIIEHLYKAAYAGVQVDLIVRGVCCLKPKLKNINIISIIDRYLEHSRIFFFKNNGNPEYYLSSADWMPRNLDKRIELSFPVEDDFTKNLLHKILHLQLNDNYKGRRLNKLGNYPRPRKRDKSTRSQIKTYDILKKYRPIQKHEKMVIFKKITDDNF